MTCPSCGRDNAAAVSFCTFCGSALPATAAAPIQTSLPPAHSAAANAGKMATSFLASLTLTEKIVGAGALIAIIGFFLPFIAIPGFGDIAAMAMPDPTGAPDMPSSSLSLLGLTKFAGAVYFILLGALVSAGLLYLARSAGYSRKMLLSGIQVMIGSMVGPGTLLALLFASTVRSVASAGFWIVSLGYCSIVAGGLMTIVQLSKAER